MLGKDVFEKIKEMICNDIDIYEKEIELGFLKCEEKSYSISLGVKIKPDEEGYEVKTSIGFVKDRIKDSHTEIVEVPLEDETNN